MFSPATYVPPPSEPYDPPPEPGPEPNRDSWIEYDQNGVALGIWDWDPVSETWIFTPFPPLADMPQTGELNLHVVLLPTGFVMIGTGLLIRRIKRRKREWPEFL